MRWVGMVSVVLSHRSRYFSFFSVTSVIAMREMRSCSASGTARSSGRRSSRMFVWCVVGPGVS